MNKSIFTFLILATFAVESSAQIAISTARGLSLGTTVTIRGIATSGSELGVIRYLQDTTAGMAAYSASLVNVKRGDDVTITGQLKEFNNLLEIDPVTSYTIHSSGNPLPAPKLLTPGQLAEQYESQLVEINNAVFALGGTSFNGNTSYTFTASSQNSTVYIRTGHPVVGQTIPTMPVVMTGICSQFQTSYQVLIRDMNDLVSTTPIFLTNSPYASGITPTGLNIRWNTNIAGSSFIRYGKTNQLELGIINGVGGSTAHTVALPGNAAEIYYVKAFSVAGPDTAFSGIKVFSTASNSTGDIKIYFTRPVDNSVSTGTPAVYLNQSVDDTLIAYMNRVKTSMDVAIYNLNNSGLSNISQAINDAHNRGVKVRVIYDSSTANLGIGALDAGIPKMASPLGIDYGIMHHKFAVMDALNADAGDALVWTGSTNLTSGQINSDANNVIIIQDQSLAKAYRIEFEEMWGDTGMVPKPSTARYGKFKSDNTPHQFVIGGKPAELYFSPSDGTNSRILETINSADTDLHFAVMAFTRTDLASAIVSRAQAGVNAYGITNDTSSSSAAIAFNIMKPVLGPRVLIKNQSGIMHHKYMIVDHGNTLADPQVLTGSHNWSNSADNQNDENTLVIRDHTVANQYFQEFTRRFKDNGGILGIGNPSSSLKYFMAYPNPSDGSFRLAYTLHNEAAVAISIIDPLGRTVWFSELRSNLGTHEMAMDLTGVQSGLYFIRLETEGSAAVTRMVIR